MYDMSAPRYEGLAPSSAKASAAARGSSRKADTKPEMLLRRALWKKGFRYRKNRVDLRGAPDVVFPGARVIVFVDGDFWHGKNIRMLKTKLRQGHNADYWMRKIENNAARDQDRSRELCAAGWIVLRFWESDIYADLDGAVRRVESALGERAPALTRRKAARHRHGGAGG